MKYNEKKQINKVLSKIWLEHSNSQIELGDHATVSKTIKLIAKELEIKEFPYRKRKN